MSNEVRRLIAQFEEKTGLHVAGVDQRGIVVEIPKSDGSVKVERESWQEVEACV